jgi:hypothetical protein
MCPECETVYRSWPFLKGHLMKVHNHQELKEATAETFKDYGITDEEAQERKKKKTPEKKQITEVPTEPVERLDALLDMNGIEDEARERCVGIFRLNPSWHYDPYQVEQLLVAQGATKRRELVVSIVKQYIGDLKVPPDIEGSTFSQPGRGGGAGAYGRTSGGVGGEYPGYPRPGGGTGFVTHEELYRQQETQKLEQQVQQLLNRTAELEGKLKQRGPQAGDQTGDQRTMTIADEHGNPMIVPYDPTLMDAIRREQEARARKAEREELINQMTGLGLGKGTGGEDVKEAVKEALKPYEEEIKASREQVTKLQDELRQQQQDQTRKQIEAAQEEAKGAKAEAREAKEMAAAAAKGDKTMADYLGEAGVEAKDAIQKAAKDIKEGLTDAGERVASIVTGRAPVRREAPKSPGDIAAIIGAEDEFLAKLQPKGG